MHKRRRNVIRAAALACAAAAAGSLGPMASMATAQTWVSPVSGVWSDFLNWTSPPASGPSTALFFPSSGSQSYVAMNDFPGPFTLDRIHFNGTSSGAVEVATGSLSTLRFGGPGSQINNSGVGPAILRGRVYLDAPTTTLNVGPGVANSTAVSATMLGNGALVLTNPLGAPVSLASGNTFAGGVTLNAGRIDLGAQTSLGRGALSANGGVLATSLAVTPKGNPPFSPVFSNAVVTSGAGLTIGGANGYTLAGTITGSGGVTLNPVNDLNATWTLAGNNTFTGPMTLNGSPTPGVTSTLVVNGPASLGSPSLINFNTGGARLVFVGGSAPVTIKTPIVLGAGGGSIGAFSESTNADVTLAGNISGSGGLTRTHGGFLTLANTNSFAGPLTLAAGTTIASNDGNLGAGGPLVLAGGALVLNPAVGALNRPVSVTQSGSTLHVLGNASLNTVASGPLPVAYTKSGAGNLSVLGASTFVGSITVNGGTMTAGGAAGRLNGGAGSLTIDQGAGVVLDNSGAVAARLNGGTSITLNGGNLTLIGNPSVNSGMTVTTNLFAGQTNQGGAGLSTVRATAGASANAAMRFNNVTRTQNNGSMLLFTGQGLGANTIASLTPGATNISFQAAPALVNGILPYAIADAAGGAGTDFATYTAANGVRPLATYAPDLNSGATTNASVGTAAAGVGGSTINALKMTGGTIDATTSLRVTSGALLVTGPTTISGGTLAIGTANTNSVTAPVANLFTNADLTISSRISNFRPNAGLTSGIAKSGAGVLTLAGLQNYAGPTFVHSGTLRLAAANSIPNGSELFVAPGALVDLTGFSGFNVTVGSLNQTEPPQTIGNNPHGTVNIGANTLTFGGDNLSTTINLNLIGTGALNKGGLGTMTVIGNQAFTGTVNLASGAIVLGTHFADGTGLRNAARINVGTSAVSGDVTLGFTHGLRDGFNVPIFAQAQAGRTATLQFVSGTSGTPGVVFASPITLNSAQGLIVDSSGGTTLSGLISGTGPLTTATSATSLENGPDSFALSITGANTYTGATTLAAVSTLWGHANAFGNAASAIGLGHPNGPDNPELSSATGGLTLARNITVNNSLNAVAQFATIGSHAPAGSGTTTYSGNISIAGSRDKLVLYSRSSPVSFTGTISGLTPEASVQIGASLGPGLEWTDSNVSLSGANTYAGGTQLVTGTLNINASTNASGTTIFSGPVGTGTLTIGSPETIGAAAEPTIAAPNGARTIANPIVIANNFSVAGPNPLLFNGAVNLGDAPRFVTIANAPLQIQFAGPISGAPGSALVKEGPGVLIFSGPVSHPGPTVAAQGTLAFTTTQNLGGLLGVAGGARANLTAGGGKVIVAPAVYVETVSGSRLDLNDNSFIVDYSGTSSPIVEVRAALASGYAGGAWNGPGIMSTTAGGVTTHGLGVGEASALGVTSFAGQFVDSTAVLVRYTRYGDADLNGVVNLSDFNRLAVNFGTTGKFWYEGDFNYDGMVNLLDFNRLAANFGLSAGPDGVVDPQDWAALASVVPEPCTLGFAALGAIALGRRRRRA